MLITDPSGTAKAHENVVPYPLGSAVSFDIFTPVCVRKIWIKLPFVDSFWVEIST